MGFWGRVKDVLASGPTTAVKNERAEDAAERAAEAAEKARDKVDSRVDPPKVEVPPQSAPQPPVSTPEPEPTAEPAAAEPEYRTYTVKSGDTLSEIAASFGVDWHEMARLNNLDNPDLIFPGQVFKVPNS
jgi:nucleoid-associated protein YgaU